MKIASSLEKIINSGRQAIGWAAGNPRKFLLGAGLAIACLELATGRASALTLDATIRLFGYTASNVSIDCIAGGQNVGPASTAKISAFDGGTKISLPDYQGDRCPDYIINASNGESVKHIQVTDSQLAGVNGALDIGRPAYTQDDFGIYAVAAAVVAALVFSGIYALYRLKWK